MHEVRTPSGPRRSAVIPLLPRQTGSIAPDHPPKHSQAWVIHRLIVYFTFCIFKHCSS